MKNFFNVLLAGFVLCFGSNAEPSEPSHYSWHEEYKAYVSQTGEVLAWKYIPCFGAFACRVPGDTLQCDGGEFHTCLDKSFKDPDGVFHPYMWDNM